MTTEDGFAARLKELREQAGLTQQALADAAGMHRFGVAKLEQGLREPSWGTVKALCQALGVSCEAFNQEAAARPPTSPGRPRKTEALRHGKAPGKPAREQSAGRTTEGASGKGKRPRGRKKDG